MAFLKNLISSGKWYTLCEYPKTHHRIHPILDRILNQLNVVCVVTCSFSILILSCLSKCLLLEDVQNRFLCSCLFFRSKYPPQYSVSTHFQCQCSLMLTVLAGVERLTCMFLAREICFLVLNHRLNLRYQSTKLWMWIFWFQTVKWLANKILWAEFYQYFPRM